MSGSAEPYDLQFSTVEPAPASAGASPAAVPSGAVATVAAAPVCVGCKQAIAQTYYAVGDKVICPRCQQQLTAGPAGGSKFGRLAKATALGLAGAIVGTLIWFAVRHITGYEIGLIAVVVGLIVGGAVRAGSGGRGGRGYQILAVLLTYFAISANYMPDLIQGFVQKYKEDKAAVHSVAGTTSTAAAPKTESTDTTDSPDATSSGTAQPARRPPSLGRALVALVLLIGLSAVLMLVVPILVGIHSPIGLLIMGFALYEAWKINARRRLAISGPYSLGVTGGPAVSPVGTGI
ncbi:MAG TPA: hypothetical protein VGI81_27660 [Tepidisphaeraceae bacterium]